MLTTEQLFNQLAIEWNNDTGWSSSLDYTMSHPNVEKIKSIGEPAIPLILKLFLTPGKRGPMWYLILNDLCKSKPDFSDIVTPVPGRIIGERWLVWGRENGYVGR